MSDSDSGMEELQELIAEYEAKTDGKCDNHRDKEHKKHRPLSKNKIHRPEAEVPMDKVLFGDRKGLLRNLAKAVGDVEENNNVRGTDPKVGQRSTKKRQPAWEDSDDDNIATKYRIKRHPMQSKPLKEYLQKQFHKVVAQPKWASLDRKSEEDSEDDELFRTAGFISTADTNVLKSQLISIHPQRDLNRATYAEGKINSVEFHSTSTAALIAGDSGMATIYAVDGVDNEKLHNIYFKNFPIKCAKIAPCGTKAFFGSSHRHYYVYDLIKAQETRYKLPKEVTTAKNFQLSPCGQYIIIAGRFGYLHLFDVASKELLHTLHQENNVVNMCFTRDSQRIICNSNSNESYIFSMRTRRLEHTFVDEGCIEGSVIDLSPHQQLLATGSKEGVVNVYDHAKLYTTKYPKPLKTFYNLTTSIADVKFNHSSEVLGMCSKESRNAFKLAHFPSATVYSNFPVQNSEYNKVAKMQFSPTSGYLAMATTGKAVKLFRLKHFKNY